LVLKRVKHLGNLTGFSNIKPVARKKNADTSHTWTTTSRGPRKNGEDVYKVGFVKSVAHDRQESEILVLPSVFTDLLRQKSPLVRVRVLIGRCNLCKPSNPYWCVIKYLKVYEKVGQRLEPIPPQ
jgi:hypothetical protein